MSQRNVIHRGEEFIAGVLCLLMMAGFLYIIARPFVWGAGS